MSETEYMNEIQRQAYLNALTALYALWATLEPNSPAQMGALLAMDEVRNVPRNMGP